MEKQRTETEHQIDRITYIVAATPGNEARETLEAKINKLLQKDIRHCAPSQA